MTENTYVSHLPVNYESSLSGLTYKFQEGAKITEVFDKDGKKNCIRFRPLCHSLSAKKKQKATYIYSDRSKYVGEVNSNGLSNGQVISYYPNGKIEYEGGWRDGQRHGNGRSFCLDGTTIEYDGEWRDGQRHGNGRSFYLDDTTVKYDGQWRDGQQNGRGISYMNRKKLYEGEWRDGKKHGKGRSFCLDGTTIEYDGEWRDGEKYGQGISCYLNGKIEYDGEWQNGEKHGKGRSFYLDGTTIEYDGEWRDGQRHGNGRSFYLDDTTVKYDGQWRDGQQNGRGISYMNRKKLYEGEWRDGKKHGKGRSFCLDGTTVKYDGEWRYGQQNGRGVYTYQDGDVYDGEWLSGEKYGQGTYYFRDGSKREGKILDDIDGNKEFNGKFYIDNKLVYKITTDEIYDTRRITAYDNNMQEIGTLTINPDGTSSFIRGTGNIQDLLDISLKKYNSRDPENAGGINSRIGYFIFAYNIDKLNPDNSLPIESRFVPDAKNKYKDEEYAKTLVEQIVEKIEPGKIIVYPTSFTTDKHQTYLIFFKDENGDINMFSINDHDSTENSIFDEMKLINGKKLQHFNIEPVDQKYGTCVLTSALMLIEFLKIVKQQSKSLNISMSDAYNLIFASLREGGVLSLNFDDKNKNLRLARNHIELLTKEALKQQRILEQQNQLTEAKNRLNLLQLLFGMADSINSFGPVLCYRSEETKQMPF